MFSVVNISLRSFSQLIICSCDSSARASSMLSWRSRCKSIRALQRTRKEIDHIQVRGQREVAERICGCRRRGACAHFQVRRACRDLQVLPPVLPQNGQSTTLITLILFGRQILFGRHAWDCQLLSFTVDSDTGHRMAVPSTSNSSATSI
jgi:hypothetical protein